MHVSGRPVGSFDNEGLIFAAGVDAEVIRLYDLRSFDKVFVRSFTVLQLKFKINNQLFVSIFLANSYP